MSVYSVCKNQREKERRSAVRVIKAEEAKMFLDESEVCRQYIKTGKITFGTSVLLSGQSGGTDTGHPESHEIFYCSRGHVAVYNRESGRYYELKEGDILLIEEGEPHQITNIGSDTAVITWSCAPDMNPA